LASTVQMRPEHHDSEVWIDIDNAPQVLVLDPILKELGRRGFIPQITARDFGQTFALLLLHGLAFRAVGHHAGRNKFRKVAELASRSFRLWRMGRKQDFRVVVSCGARASVLPALMLGLPLVTVIDYEHIFAYPFIKWAQRILTPNVIPDEDLLRLGYDLSKVRKFPGLKEELYVFDFQPDRASLEAAGIDFSRTVIAVRPPATMAHYHSQKSEAIFWAVLQHLLRQPEMQIVVLPRVQAQGDWVLDKVGLHENLLIPDSVQHGPNLLWHMDAMFGGGGTMNREAACLDVPTYSFFNGPLGAVDRYLSEQKKLTLLGSLDQVDAIKVGKRTPRPLPPRDSGRKVLNFIVEQVLEVALS
jgi:predicted glycosyltransferase